jgi:hypothetical protein
MSLGQSCISSYLFVGGEEGLNLEEEKKGKEKNRKTQKKIEKNRKEKNKTWNNVKEVRKKKGEIKREKKM